MRDRLEGGRGGRWALPAEVRMAKEGKAMGSRDI